MADILLVCEGTAKSLDNRVLDALVVQHGRLPVIIAPANGDKGLSAIRAYLEASRATSVLSIEDRDYRPLNDALTSWQGSKALVWTRHEIENYLLEPRVVHGAFQRLSELTGRNDWSRRLPSSIDDVATFLSDLARPLLEHHAGQVLFAEMARELRRATLQPRFPFSGIPAHGRTEWLSALRDELRRLCMANSDMLASLEHWSSGLEDRLDRLCEKYLAPEFLTSGGYLRDMDGHQLFSALLAALRDLGAHRLLPATLEDELLKALTALYSQGQVYERDDFALLRDRLKSAGAEIA